MYQQPPFTARCAQGQIIIDNNFIIIERGNLTSETMPRTAFTGLNTRMTLWFFGWTRYNLVFQGQGNQRLRATNVSKGTLKAVKRVLTGR